MCREGGGSRDAVMGRDAGTKVYRLSGRRVVREIAQAQGGEMRTARGGRRRHPPFPHVLF